MRREEGYTENDWKLFKSRIADWQEAYIGLLNAEYAALLMSDQLESEKFWALEKRIRNDRRKAGVVVEMRRSALVDNLLRLLSEGAITLDDLEGFSDEIIETLKSAQRHRRVNL